MRWNTAGPAQQLVEKPTIGEVAFDELGVGDGVATAGIEIVEDGGGGAAAAEEMRADVAGTACDKTPERAQRRHRLSEAG